MESDVIKQSLLEYKEQLNQVELAISVTAEGDDKNNLLTLRTDIKHLIELTEESLGVPSSSSVDAPKDHLEDEYSLFMAEMAKDGAVESKAEQELENLREDLKKLEGTKCRAPHQHSWGDTVYHNALISTVMPLTGSEFNDIEVKVLFTNPTHQEMLPCPYLLESECKFDDEKCRFSHGEVVLFAKLEEYVEPEYESLEVGSFVLAKNDKLWHRGVIKRLYSEKCLVKFDSNNKELELEFCDVHPMNEMSYIESESEDESAHHQDVINMSLMITPTTEKMGEWEKFTKGVGSKLMQKMGYVIGTGLGKYASGRLDPVTAVVLPAGKSLDHCMDLREKSGGDKNLFSVERKLKRLRKKQELRNKKIYERESKKVDVFNFLNSTLSSSKQEVCLNEVKSDHRKEIKKETCRHLNIESLKIDESIKEVERDIYKITESLSRHRDVKSQIHRELNRKLVVKKDELKILRGKALNIHNEKSLRNDNKKLTVF